MIEIVGADAATRRDARRLLERVAEEPIAFAEPDATLRVEALRVGLDASTQLEGRAADGSASTDRSTIGLDPYGEQAEADARRLVRCARRRSQFRGASSGYRHHFEALFDGYGRAVLVLDLEGVIFDANLAARQLLGRPLQQVLGSSFESLLSEGELPLDPRSRQISTAGTQQARTRPDRLIGATRRFARADGASLQLTATLHPVLDADRRPLFAVVELTNPLRETLAPRDRRESEAIAEALKRVDGLAAKGSHPQRVFSEALRRCSELLDATTALLLSRTDDKAGLRVVACHSADDRLESEALLATEESAIDDRSILGRALRARAAVVVPESTRLGSSGELGLEVAHALALPMRRADDTIGVMVLANGPRPLDLADAEILRPLTATLTGVIAADIERRRSQLAESTLVENERTIATLLANLPGVIFRAQDDDLRTLTYVSPGITDLLRRGPHDVAGIHPRGLLEFTTPADRGTVLDDLRWAVLQKQRYDAVYRMERDGETIWVHEQSQGVFGGDGDLLFVEGFLTDVTAERAAEDERLRLEQRARRSQKIDSLATLAQGVAHDFSNLMLGVLGNLQVVSDAIESAGTADEDASTALREIETAAERTTDLARYMLAYTGEEEVLLEAHDAVELTRRSLPLVERQLGPNVALSLDLPETPVGVTVDPGPFQRALVEAAKNAADAIGENDGRVWLRVTRIELDPSDLAETWLGPRLSPGEYVAIDIEDDGAGIRPEDLDTIFERFTRGAAAKTGHVGGSGLGLFLVREILRAHGGSIRALSDGTGRG
ncbi:MAG: ATP-binding protein, partial [Planctomycetota bacterium]